MSKNASRKASAGSAESTPAFPGTVTIGHDFLERVLRLEDDIRVLADRLERLEHDLVTSRPRRIAVASLAERVATIERGLAKFDLLLAKALEQLHARTAE